MTKRSDISKQVSRRGGGYPKTGKGTSLKKINKERGQWEMLPGTGTSPYNPPKWRKKKTKAKATVTATPKARSVTKVRGPEDYRQEDVGTMRASGLKNKAIREEIRRQTAERNRARARASMAAVDKPVVLNPELKAKLMSVRERQANRPSIGSNSKGGKVVAALYKEI